MSAKVYLVGIGPGQAEYITPQALEAIQKAEVIVGHPSTLALIDAMTRNKEVLTVNQGPIERSRLAIEKSKEGHEVAIISSGDPGVYAIAATFLGYLKDNNITLEVEVVPGLGLAAYAAARLGAPLGNDTASISLTDRGTPWPDIRARLEAASAAGFVIVIYNPFGKLGPARLQEALRIIMEHRSGTVPVGVLSQAATPDEKVEITTIEKIEIPSLPVDTLIIIGNAQSYVKDGRMVTPRLYRKGVGY